MPASTRAIRLVISPHFDDAVLGLGDFLHRYPQTIVATVFARRPPAGIPLQRWDADAGYVLGDDVVGARRAEDRLALARLRAQPLWLRFLDAQYGPSRSPRQLAAGLRRAIARVGASHVYIPLGLSHSDHHLAAEAGLLLVARDDTRQWFAYADALYRGYDGLLPARLRDLRARGFRLTALRLPVRPAGPAKREAIAGYGSQLRALATPGRPGLADALRPEQLWRLRAGAR